MLSADKADNSCIRSLTLVGLVGFCTLSRAENALEEWG